MGCHVGSKGVLTSTAELEWSSMAAAHSRIIAVCRVEPGLCRMHAHVFTEHGIFHVTVTESCHCGQLVQAASSSM